MSHLLCKMSKPTNDWINRVLSTATNGTKLFSIATAYALAYKLSLPASEVSEIETFYRQDKTATVLRMLNEVNSILPFDFRTSKELVKDFYIWRYRQAFGTMGPSAFSKKDPIENFFGLSRCFPNEVLDMIRQDPDRLTTLTHQLQAFIKEITQSKIAEEGQTGDIKIKTQFLPETA